MNVKATSTIAALTFLICLTRGLTLQAAPPDLEKVRATKIVAIWHFTDKAQMKAAFAEHLDVLEFDYGRSVTFLTDAESLAKLQDRGYDIEIEIPDVYEFHHSRLQPTDMGGYRTFDEIVMALDTLHNLNPAISTEKFSIGQTIEGREMWMLKISDNPEVDEDEPESFFDAAIHAREVITPLVLIESMRTLIEGYGVDTFLTRLVDTREIFFLPCFNADGYYYNQILEPGGGGMWRKNRRDNGDGTFGVDLNRNFSYQWGYDDVGSSPYTYDATYRGTGPASEPEVQHVIDFVESRELAVYIDFHSYSNLIIWPYGYDYNIYSPDEALFAAMGDSMSTFNGYTATVAWVLYPTNGATDDWMYGEQTTKDKIFAFTFEVGSSSDGFWPQTYRIPQLVNENIPAVLYLIDVSANPETAAPPLAPVWTSAAAYPTGFFDLTWSQPDNNNEIVSFDLQELSGAHTGTDDAESGPGHWVMDGFFNSTARAYEGAYSFYSDQGDGLNQTMTTLYPLYVADGETLEFYTWYRIETDWDYAYVEASTNSETGFVPLAGNITTNYNPYGSNRGNGITGYSGGWVAAQFDLSDYSGQYVYLRFTYNTDSYVTEEGFYADIISPLTWYDQITMLAEGFTDSTYAIHARPPDEYYFQARATDSDSQVGPYSALLNVHVAGEVVYGDLDNNGLVNPVDVIWLVNFVYRSGPGPIASGAEYIDGDNLCNPVDVIYLVNHVYRGRAAPLGYGE